MPRVTLLLAVGLAIAGPARAASSPQLAKGPYLTDLSDQRVEVRFELEAAAPASVILSPQGDAGPPRTVDVPSGCRT
jgi:hypothetical protein